MFTFFMSNWNGISEVQIFKILGGNAPYGTPMELPPSLLNPPGTPLKTLLDPPLVQNMLINFRLHHLLYTFNRGVDASQANLLKRPNVM